MRSYGKFLSKLRQNLAKVIVLFLVKNIKLDIWIIRWKIKVCFLDIRNKSIKMYAHIWRSLVLSFYLRFISLMLDCTNHHHLPLIWRGRKVLEKISTKNDKKDFKHLRTVGGWGCYISLWFSGSSHGKKLGLAKLV